LKLCQKILLSQIFVIFLSVADIGRAQEVYGPPTPSRQFKEGCIFLGIAKKGEALVAFYLREERWTQSGVIINAILVPTDKFPFESGYRGFQKKEHYRIKEGRGLHLSFEGRMESFSLRHHIDIGDTSPMMVEFRSRGKNRDLIPDDVEMIDFEVKDVSKWVKVPKKELPMWSRSFDEMEDLSLGRVKTTGVRSRTEEKDRVTVREINEADYQGRYVTLNGTYLFERKTVYSNILAVFDVGTFLEHTKPAGGSWMEVLYGDSKQKGYVLAIYLVDDEEEALQWEIERGLTPVEPPLGQTPSDVEPEEVSEP
jgi:hypothetical protein